MIEPWYDLHVHTYLNGHSDPAQDVPTILARADALGLRAIAITKHVTEPAHVGWVREIAGLVERHRGRCRVIVGAEVDVDTDAGDGRLVVEPDGLMQLVLGSIHLFPGTRLMPHLGQVPEMSRGEIIDRWRRAFLGLASNPRVDIIAHPGALIANALPAEEFSPDVLEVFSEAARLSAAHGIAWEVNRLIGAKLRPGQRAQYWRVIKTAVDANVALVYGSDAHKPGDIASTVFVRDVMAALGGWAPLDRPRLPRRPGIVAALRACGTPAAAAPPRTGLLRRRADAG